ncbi:MAG TPA: hypothetical protein VNK52_14335 [Hyphomicrobiaceae bacterium]|nr:hypothetical protein [Hyphomicrobiaceae bacterium]
MSDHPSDFWLLAADRLETTAQWHDRLLLERTGIRVQSADVEDDILDAAREMIATGHVSLEEATRWYGLTSAEVVALSGEARSEQK